MIRIFDMSKFPGTGSVRKEHKEHYNENAAREHMAGERDAEKQTGLNFKPANLVPEQRR